MQNGVVLAYALIRCSLLRTALTSIVRSSSRKIFNLILFKIYFDPVWSCSLENLTMNDKIFSVIPVGGFSNIHEISTLSHIVKPFHGLISPKGTPEQQLRVLKY